jgi:hypothetical protein
VKLSRGGRGPGPGGRQATGSRVSLEADATFQHAGHSEARRRRRVVPDWLHGDWFGRCQSLRESRTAGSGNIADELASGSLTLEPPGRLG